MKSSLQQFIEAKTEGSEGKVENVEAKALTVEKIVESREPNEL